MNDLVHAPQNNDIKISSRDIASLTNKEHKNVKRDIESALEKDVLSFERIYKDSMNREQVEYILPKNIALGIVSGYSFELRMKIINRLEELETLPQQFQLPQNYIEALEALTASEKEKLVLAETIVKKDEVILAVADLNIKAGEVTIGDFSKNLAIEGLGRNNLFTWLRGRGFLALDTSPYQQYVARGYFVRRPSKNKHNGEVRYTTLLTPKGTVWLTKMIKAEYDLD